VTRFCLFLILFTAIFTYLYAGDDDALQGEDSDQGEAQEEASVTIIEGAIQPKDENSPPHKEGDPLKALVETNRDGVFENMPIEITILVNYDDPRELTVKAPDLNEDWVIDKAVLSPYISPSSRAAQGRRDADEWSQIDIFIVPLRAGSLTLGSFSISSPYDTVKTLPLVWDVKTQKVASTPKLVWTGSKSLSTGSSLELGLKILNWDRTKPTPRDLRAYIAAPPNAIIENLALNADDKFNGIVLRLKVTALDDKNIKIPQNFITYQEWDLEIPAITINVSKSKTIVLKKDKPMVLAGNQYASIGNDSVASTRGNLQGNATGKGNAAEKGAPFNNNLHDLSFPGTKPFENNIFVKISGKNWTKTTEMAKNLWENGFYAGSLALLRSAEKESIAGSSYTALRMEAEKKLGVISLDVENRFPRDLFLLVAALFLLFILMRAGLFVKDAVKNTRIVKTAIGKIGRNALREKIKAPVFPYKSVIISFIIALFAVSAYFYSGINFNKNAVMTQCNFYGIPETDENPLGVFTEGVPVRIVAREGDWLYVESLDSAGWVHKTNAIVY